VQRIFIPNSAAIRQARHVLKPADWSVGGDTVVEFHPAYCHMQPWVLSAVAAWAVAHRKAGGRVVVKNAERARYGWRFGLGEYLEFTPPATPTEHEQAGRFVPLRTIASSKDLTDLLADIVTLLHVDAESSKAIMYAISEMVRNTLEHSQSATGAVVCAQNYSGRNGRKYVSIGVADTGIGIRESLGANYPMTTDRKAILQAIKPGVSGAQRGPFGSSDNAGAGLFITRRLSQASGGYFAVASGEAIFRSSNAARPPGDDQLVLDIAPYPGTIVSVEVGLDQESDFATTFADARAAFGAQAKTGRKEIAKRVRFT
jgi:anti-sigma regulatory factor (Ser/Thr protein kinase)